MREGGRKGERERVREGGMERVRGRQEEREGVREGGRAEGRYRA